MPTPPKIITDHQARFEELRAARSLWESQWLEIGQLVLPRRIDYNRGFSNTGTPNTQGQILSNRIFDPTASFAAEQLASFLGTQLINPQEDWFNLTFRDERLNEDQSNAIWLRTTKDLMMAELNSPTSSFHTAASEAFLELVVFGTASLSLTENAFGRPVFVARPLTEIYAAENADADIDTIYRKFDWTPRQIRQFFGDNLPEPLATILNKVPAAEQLTRKFPILHCVYPRDERDPYGRSSSNMPWASLYFSLEPPALIRESGFLENPFIVPRWSKTPGDVYGRSPAFTVMPDIRMLQIMSKVVISAAQTRAKKPIMIPDDGFIGQLNLIPGGTLVYRATTRPENRIIPLDLADEPGIGLDLIQNRQENVLRAFFVDVIRGISMRGDASPLKATEVVERRNEALQTLVPPLTRVQREALSPIIERVFSMMLRNSLFPPPPPTIAGAQLDVEFVAPAVIAARMGEAEKMNRTIAQLIPLVQIDPMVIENFDRDKWVRRIAALNGVSPDLLAPAGTAQKARDEQKQQAEQMQATAMGSEMAKAAGALQ